MRRLGLAFAIASTLLVSIACAESPAGQAASAAAETLKADSPRTTVDGTQFVAPAEWSIRVAGPATVLEAPEHDSRVALVDIKADDADAAVAAAWTAYDAKASWPLKVATDFPGKDGWEKVRGYTYETSANDERFVVARAFHANGEWTVVIVDVSNAVGEKRGAQLQTILDKLLPKGYSRESFAGKTAHPLDAGRVDTLKRFVESARQQLDVPGVAIGLIDHDKVVFAGGFGVRELGKSDPVDAKTLFMIASNTKAMTTLMLAKLVDAKKFEWTTPVTQLLPTFKLGNADTTRQVLVKHLICACTGMPRQDMEWIFESEHATPESVVTTLGTMQPTTKFGELFQYSNLMAAAGGFVGGHVLYPDRELGAAYDAAMQVEVFGPLGMTATTFETARARRGDHAEPHGLDVDGKTARADAGINATVMAARPAGAAWSDVDDLLRYVRMELDKGVLPDGRRYISEAALLARRDPQVAIGNNVTYGMGLMVDRTWGVPVVHHGGDLVGFHSDMMWLPDSGVGAVILTNADAGVYLRGPLQRRLLEVLFDGKPQAEADVAAAVRRLNDDIAAERKRLTVPADATESAKLAAHYNNEALGDIAVLHAAGRTTFDFGGWKSEVASRRNDDGTLSYVTISPGEDGFEFVVADDALVLRDAQHEYRFAAVAKN